MCSPIWATNEVTLRNEEITQGGCLLAPQSSRLLLGRGAMKVTKELVVRGSAAAAGLMVLVSVVGAGTKWMN